MEARPAEPDPWASRLVMPRSLEGTFCQGSPSPPSEEVGGGSDTARDTREGSRACFQEAVSPALSSLGLGGSGLARAGMAGSLKLGISH